MSGKKHGNYQSGGDKKTRDRTNRLNPRGKKKAGRRPKHKLSKTKKYLVVNTGKIGIDHQKIKTLLPKNPLNRQWAKDKETNEFRKKNNL